MRLIVYEKKAQEKKGTLQEVRRALRAKKRFWLDITGPEDLGELGKLLNIHPLVLEDLYHEDLRPKLEHYKNHSFVVTYGFRRKNGLQPYKIDLIIGKRWIVSAHKNPVDSYLDLREEQLNYLFKKGMDFLVHRLIDLEVDTTMRLLDEISDDIEKEERKVLRHTKQDPIPDILELRRELLSARKLLIRQRDVMSQISKQDITFVSKEGILYYRDLYDHLVLAIDQIDTQRETLSNIMEIHFSMVSNRMNEVMKVLTIIATVLLPVTAIASVYGMNFRYMPELYHPWGYPAVIAVMVLTAGGMLVYFRYRRWV